MSDALVSGLHYLAILVLFSALVVEHLQFRPSMDAAAIRRLALVDLIYGIAAGVVLATGLAKVFWTGKPPSYYGQNWLFHIKFFLFIGAGLMSIWPARHFLRARRKVRRSREIDPRVELPRAIVYVIRLELLVLLTIPVLSAYIARGYAYFGG